MPIIFKYNFDWGRQGTLTLFESIKLVFFIYFPIVWRSRGEATLLVTIIIPVWFMHTKSAITSDFISFRALLRLVIWVLDNYMNFDLFLLFLYQQFIMWGTKAVCSDYLVATIYW